MPDMIPLSSPRKALLATVLGIAAFSALDASMKSATLLAGVLTPLLLRYALGAALVFPVWLYRGGGRPSRAAFSVHLQRTAISVVMAALFFYGLARVPLAEAIALSFIAPLIALFLSAILLNEKVRISAIVASLMGICGVLVITVARVQGDLAWSPSGTAAILVSAVLYAFNLVLQRRQAQLARPLEIALVQNAASAIMLCPAMLIWGLWPIPAPALGYTALAAVFSTLALLLLAWGYARAEVQVLLPVEYTALGWAALFGWVLFREPVMLSTLTGALFIIGGCWIATRSASPARTRS